MQVLGSPFLIVQADSAPFLTVGDASFGVGFLVTRMSLGPRKVTADIWPSGSYCAAANPL